MPPDSRGNPFDRGAKRGRSRLLLVGVGTLVITAIVVGLIWIVGGGSSSFEASPGPLVADLEATDWRYPVDRATGYQRLATPLREGTSFDRVAANAAGKIALGARLDGVEPWVLVWQNSSWEAHAFTGHEAITALGVDPEGVVHVGFSDGSLVRIGTAGEVVEEGVVASGFSIVGFAFDRDSKKSALMLSGGEVRTGLRPLRRELLHTVTMPPRARIRKLVYSEDGELVVAGDAGALFVATEDGWEEGSLPTSGNVAALGVGPDGDLLVAQANGHVFRGSGVTWDRVGQLNGNPVAVGAIPDRGIVVATTNGRIYATLDRDDFSEMPGYQAPSDLVVDDGEVAGHDVLLAARDRVLVWDGEVFDSSEAADGEGTVGAAGCEPVGPPSIGGEQVPAAVFDCDHGRHAVIAEGALNDVEVVQAGGAPVSALDFVRAMREADRRRAIWIGGRPWAPHDRGDEPGIERWSFEAGEWQPVVAIAPEHGPVLDLSAALTNEGWELWATTQTGTTLTGLVQADAEQAELLPVADHAALQELYGEEFYPSSVELHALGGQRALLLHDGWRASTVSRGPEGVQPLPLFSEPPMFRTRTVRVGDDVLLVERDRIRQVSGEAPPVEWTLPDEVDLGLGAVDRGAFDSAVKGGEVVLRGAGGTVLRCREGACTEVALPAWVTPRGVLFSRDGTLVITEPGGMVGTVAEPRES